MDLRSLSNRKQFHIDLEIKNPISTNDVISKNQNKRMEFNIGSGKLRLYFDLLNYSEFTYSVGEIIVNDSIDKIAIENNQNNNKVNDGSNNSSNNNFDNNSNSLEIPSNTLANGFLSIIGKVIGIEENSNSEIDSNIKTVNVSYDENDISKKTIEINNENNSKIDGIADNSIIPIDNFNIVLNSVPESSNNNNIPKNNQDKYKWGYKLKLNDLKFLAKVDITSDKLLTVYDGSTIKIGNKQLLSFKDLETQGYKVMIESPALDIPINLS